jgi:hypothetical protein
MSWIPDALRPALRDALPEKDFTPEHQRLEELMSAISEDCYCAGWMMGLEHAIWGALTDGDRRYGMGEMDADHLEACRSLAQSLNGWLFWIDDDLFPDLPADQWGVRFLPLAVWLDVHAAFTSPSLKD